MSHVDDGTLHAYLDGELSPVEVEHLEGHLAGCTACRSRLEEERALIERAARLLGAAVPRGPTRAAPPLHQLERRRGIWPRVRVPLAWAATIVLALGLGWYGRSLRSVDSITATAARQTDTVPPPIALAPAPQPRPSDARPARAREVEPAAVLSSSGALDQPAQARAEADETGRAAKAGVAAPAPSASNAVAAVPAAPPALERRITTELPTAWPIIEPSTARQLLGTAPVTIPGYAVRTLRRNPDVEREIVVEQEIASGVTVSLIERSMGPQYQARRQDAAALRDDERNERLARFIGGLRVEISGPLPMDSLSRLLERVTP